MRGGGSTGQLKPSISLHNEVLGESVASPRQPEVLGESVSERFHKRMARAYDLCGTVM